MAMGIDKTNAIIAKEIPANAKPRASDVEPPCLKK